MTDDIRSLSTRHARFVAEYLKDGNATQAYIRAGYKPRGAQGNASKLLHQPQIEAAITAGRQRIAASLEVTAERITAEYAKIAFASIDDFIVVDGEGRIRVDLTKAGRAQRDGLLELSVSEHGEERLQRVKIKLGKLQALAALSRMLGVQKAKPPSPADTLGEDLDAAARRAWGEKLSLGPEPSAHVKPAAQPHAEEAAELPSRSMGNGHGADGPPFETRPSGAPQGEAMPARIPTWPEFGAPLPVRGSPDHAHAYSLLRRGVLNSHEALQMIMAGLDRWP